MDTAVKTRIYIGLSVVGLVLGAVLWSAYRNQHVACTSERLRARLVKTVQSLIDRTLEVARIDNPAHRQQQAISVRCAVRTLQSLYSVRHLQQITELPVRDLVDRVDKLSAAPRVLKPTPTAQAQAAALQQQQQRTAARMATPATLRRPALSYSALTSPAQRPIAQPRQRSDRRESERPQSS